MKPKVRFDNLVNLVDRIEKDATELDSVLRQRDRPIGRELAPLADKPLLQLSAWLERISEPESPSVGARVVAALRVGTIGLLITGLCLGWLTAAAVFYYRGSHPVNIINVLAVFVGLQLLLLLVSLATFLPEPLLKLLPGMQAAREAFSLFSPGRLPRLFSRFLPARYRDAVASFQGETRAHQALYGRVEKWLLLRAGQGFGVAFNCGALLGCLSLVVFSDLAFGWSTTLQVASAELKRVTDLLSAPWVGLFPEARPSLALIEASRYFRFQAGSLPGLDGSGPAVLGTWWPFLLLCVLVYGLLPRLLTLALASLRLQSACRKTMLQLPGVTAILDRLNSQLVETRAEQPETTPSTKPQSAQQSRFAGELRDQSLAVIDWGGTGLSREPLAAWLQDSWQAELADFAEAGGAFSLDHDRQILQRLSDHSGPVMLLVKSWEPPLAEFKDFLHDLRQQLGSQRPVALLPVGLGSSAELRPADAEHEAVWATLIKQLGDPWSFIAPVPQAGRS